MTGDVAAGDAQPAGSGGQQAAYEKATCHWCDLPLRLRNGEWFSPVTDLAKCANWRAPQGVHEPAGQPYLCLTCNQMVPPDEHHPHGCPMEGDECASRTCNATGKCQA